jgi:hypothetical protein
MKYTNNKKASHFCEALSEPWRIRTSDTFVSTSTSFGEEGKKDLLKVCL